MTNIYLFNHIYVVTKYQWGFIYFDRDFNKITFKYKSLEFQSSSEMKFY